MSDEAGYDQVIAQSVDEDGLSSQGLPPVVGVEVPPGALHRHHHARQKWPLQWLQWDTNVV